MQKRSPPSFGSSLPSPFPRPSVCLVRSRVLFFRSSARGTRAEEWSKQKMRVPSVHLGLSSLTRRRLERESTHLDKPSKRTGRRNLTTNLERDGDRANKDPKRGRMNARCLQGANKNSNRTFRSSSMLLLDLLSLRP